MWINNYYLFIKPSAMESKRMNIDLLLILWRVLKFIPGYTEKIDYFNDLLKLNRLFDWLWTYYLLIIFIIIGMIFIQFINLLNAYWTFLLL